MLPFWRFAVSDGSLPKWHLRAVDYIGLGFLLVFPEELWRRPKAWYSWGGALALGILFLWLGDIVPIAWKRVLARWRSPKALAAALTENLRLCLELSGRSPLSAEEVEKLQEDNRQLRLSESYDKLEASKAHESLSECGKEKHQALVQVDELQRRLAEKSKPSKLAIHSAKYSARRGGEVYDVTDCLRQMISGDGLVLQIQNANFQIGGHNFVPKDPLEGKKKWLDVEYSFNGGAVVSIARREDYRMVLPEDTQIKQVVEELEEENKQRRAEVDDLRGKIAVFLPLQLEAFALAKNLRDFYASLGPYPSDYPQKPGEDTYAYLAKLHIFREENQAPWLQRLSHGYLNRKFGERITSLLHRAGEEIGLQYPPTLLSQSANMGVPCSEHGIPQLAQEMEMIAIWINRKQSGESDLVS